MSIFSLVSSSIEMIFMTVPTASQMHVKFAIFQLKIFLTSHMSEGKAGV